MEAPAPRKLPEGTMLDGKYRIERLLAVGGMGAVYVGTHVQLRKRVAIKVLNPQLSSAPMIERFHREAVTASQIGHEGIAQVTDIGTSHDGEPFLVMEFLEGESLASRLRATGPLAIEDACELGCAILSPLAAAHRAGIVHRDLKPDNVFLVRQSRGEMVKLLDFGISRSAGGDGEFRLTTTGLVLGTPYYMSPEQARGDTEITPAADLYAFGVMLYEMLIGNVPIQAENYNQLMYRVMTSEFARPRERRPDLPVALEQIILRAMAQDPAQRPASAAELEHALLAYCRAAFREHEVGRMSSPGLVIGGSAPGGFTTGTGPRGTGVGTDRTVLAGAQPTGGAVTRPDRPRAQPRRSRAPWILGLVVVVLGGGIATAVVVGGADPAPAPRPPTPVATATPPAPTTQAAGGPAAPVAPVAPAPAPPPQQPAAPAAPAPPAAPATITLRFSVDPSSATIEVDGKPISGTELVVAKDDASHALRITAAGYLAREETIRFDESQRLVVPLKRAPGKRPPGAHKEKPDPGVIDSESPY